MRQRTGSKTKEESGYLTWDSLAVRVRVRTSMVNPLEKNNGPRKAATTGTFC